MLIMHSVIPHYVVRGMQQRHVDIWDMLLGLFSVKLNASDRLKGVKPILVLEISVIIVWIFQMTFCDELGVNSFHDAGLFLPPL